MSPSLDEPFGRYELVSQLGRGGMAEVYRARLLGEAGVTKPVLIKKVLPEFATDPGFINMFISEARISATLSHGNIAQVYDFGRVGEEYFLAMEFVDGQPLHRVIKRALRSGLSAIPAPIALFIALEICRGLHYAHTRTDAQGRPLGLVHRDISPDNVLISYEGQVKIVDFGIAKARELRGFTTEPGVVKGKYLFFSPEQARGEEVTPLTDVWATGVVLYEMLCGRMPLEGPPYVVVPKLGKGDFPRPSEVKPDIAPALDALIMRALAVNRQDRYESSNAFAEALSEHLYSSTPRFSGLSLSHFVQELFRQDLKKQGHKVQIPRSFQEQLSAWRGEMPTSPFFATPPPSSESIAPLPPAPSRLPVFLAAGVGVTLLGAMLAALLWMKPPAERAAKDAPEPPKPRVAAHTSPPSPPPAVQPSGDPSPPVEAPVSPEPPAEPPSAVAPPEAEPAPARASASYPVEAIRLDARNDVIDPQSVPEAMDLEAGATYRVSEPEPPRDSPPLFFWLAGPALRAKDGVGVLSQKPIQVKGATALKVFALKPLPPEAPARVVLVENVQRKERQRLTLPPGTAASTERAFELKNLDAASSYRLLLVPMGRGAYTRGEPAGPLESLACARLPVNGGPSEGALAGASSREQQFLFREGTALQVSGATNLLCGFIDDDPSDNQGELQIRITRTSGGPAWPSPSPYNLVTPQKGGEARRVFDEAMQYFAERKYDRAAILAARCVSLEPSDADCHLLAGATYAAIPGRVEKATRHYQTFLKLAPQHPLADPIRRSLKEYEAQKLQAPPTP
ncbi:serine/threonine-protein kinase [Stigmatella aurantiaca]|uniref:MasK n=1 Tax=Stigmatella aurantiaca (strain DW4/3-1) TaxID=378806 RepID=Q091I9_STIAD|nr:serine/threonine-protein kinase [Stigmatella aurantiaca]ADO68857.1 Serine/threonine protein kinase [Stigmatella aurantiaca DW4/3-1]EAU66392.1 MasK [Stigmatella aurantiaca DW4/3-1]